MTILLNFRRVKKKSQAKMGNYSGAFRNKLFFVQELLLAHFLFYLNRLNRVYGTHRNRFYYSLFFFYSVGKRL